MSLHYDLPVYKASYDLLLEIFKFTKDFSKEYKYTIGEKLKNETIDLITNIYRANSVYQKKEIIQKARVNKTIRENKKLTKEELNDFISSINSYLGIMKHYKTYKIRKKILFESLSCWIYNQVYISGGYNKLVAKIKYH